MTYHFSRQVIVNSLLCGALILAGCAAPVRTALPAVSIQPPTLAPAATLTLQATAAPSATIEPSQTPSPAPTIELSPTIAPTGIFPIDGMSVEIGLHDFHALIQYQDKTAGLPGSPITQKVNFLFYLPGDYGKDPAKKWPLMLYLHGSGSRGSDLSLVRAGGLPMPLEKVKDFPFIVVSPQCPSDTGTWSGQIDAIDALLELIQAHYAVDPQRMTLTGFSMGGFGAWEYALRYPTRFAAIVPVSGGYFFQSTAIPVNLCDLKDLPVWVFHGQKDTVVALDQATTLVDALKTCHGNVRLTIYPDADHNGTARLAYYAEPDLYTWMADQKRP